MKMRPVMVLAAVGVFSVASAACGGDPEVGEIDISVDLALSNAESVVDLEFTISNGGSLDTSWAGSEVVLKFTSPTTWEAKVDGEDFDGTVTYGSCSFSFTGGGAWSGNPFQPCVASFTGDGNDANVTLNLGGVRSAARSVSISVNDNDDGTCNLVRNGVTIARVPCGSGTGATGV